MVHLESLASNNHKELVVRKFSYNMFLKIWFLMIELRKFLTKF